MRVSPDAGRIRFLRYAAHSRCPDPEPGRGRLFAAQRAGLFFGETGTGKTTNLPLSEWNTMFPNAGPRKVMLDRLTDQVHLIETGTKSYRFRRAPHRKEGG